MFGSGKLMRELVKLRQLWIESNDRSKRIESKLHVLASAQGVDLSRDAGGGVKRGTERP